MNKIAHIADIQVRKQIRHDEFNQVFSRVYEDLEKEKPLRIFLGGDIFHNKVDLSPNLITMVSNFFSRLSHIAPVDIIPGNHDMNLSQLSQGDSIFSIINILFNGVVVTNENKKNINFNKKYDDKFGIYYFPESGFYNIDENIVYGHYSCIDGNILQLSEKEKDKNKKYIALFHGQVYESMNDNGTINKDVSLLKISAFNNFDIVMMGDIHEHQSFRKNDSMAYAGSILQNGYGESINKGYLIWNLNNNSFTRKIIQNDYGFAKINLSPGELWEERLSTIKFSNNQKKTKIYIEWSDYEENYSLEKENQLVKFIKDNYGCEIVTIDFKTIFRENSLNIKENEVDSIIEKDIKELLLEWWEQNKSNYDVDYEFIEEIIKLSDKIDNDLELEPIKNYSNVFWYIKSMEVCNIFSYGTTPIFFDFEKLQGLTGIFGENYSGKTNLIKSIVWGLFQYILGGGDSKRLVNIYTNSDKGYVKTILNIAGVDYKIFRSVRNYKGRDGELKSEYEVSYEIYSYDSITKKNKWTAEINDKKTNDKKGVKELIIDSIGTAPDFAKVNLQSENGKDNYLNANQPEKNEVISKYLGLQPYQDRYDYAKKIFNETVKEQKKLGSVNDVQNELKKLTDTLKNDTENLVKLETIKKDKIQIIEKINNKILSLTTTLDKIELLSENDLNKLNSSLEIKRAEFKTRKDQYLSLDDWMSKNVKKILTEEISETHSSLKNDLFSKENELRDFLNKLPIGEKWLEDNPKQEEKNTKEFENIIFKHKEEILILQNKIPSFRGEKCPSCGSIKKISEPEKEKECILQIKKFQNEIEKNQTIINLEKKKIEHNIMVDKASNKIDTLKNCIIQYKNEISEIQRKINVLEMSKDIIDHNKIYDENHELYKISKKQLESLKDSIDSLKEHILKVESNKIKKEKNQAIQILIDTEQENLKHEKLIIYNLENQITELFAANRLTQKSLDILQNKLENIKEQEREYKKYSIYLQAVHKDGIPAQIIRKKLPIINSKIRSILKDLVEYKIDMWLDEKGNVKETFYYNEDKSDYLPMDSSSGAQGFLANLAIRDGLHYASRLPKSSMCFIDEGFGKLDSNITISMQQPLQYLKNKYRNVFVVTHKDIIKEYMDHVITVSKTTSDISLEYREKYPQAWNTCIDIR